MFVTKRKYDEMVCTKDKTIKYLESQIESRNKIIDELIELTLDMMIKRAKCTCDNAEEKGASIEEKVDEKKEVKNFRNMPKFPSFEKSNNVIYNDVFFLEVIRKKLNVTQKEFIEMMNISSCIYGKMVSRKSCYTRSNATKVFVFLQYLSEHNMYDFNCLELKSNKSWREYKLKYDFDFEYLEKSRR